MQTVDCGIGVRVGGRAVEGIAPIAVEHGEKREQEVKIAAAAAGIKEEVEFLLHQPGEREPHSDAYLPIDVWGGKHDRPPLPGADNGGGASHRFL